MDMQQVDPVGKLMTDVYFGDGKENPSILTRLDRVEQTVEVIVENSKQLKWAIYAAIVALVLNMISPHIHF